MNILKKLFKKKKQENVNIVEINLKNELSEIDELNMVLIPRTCYMIAAGDDSSVDYDIFFDGEKVTDVFAVVRYGNMPTDERKVKSWKKEMKGE